MAVLLLLLSFALIIGGALLFTNAVEWLGQRLNLGQGAVGSLLAAVGTALPESTIPLVALISGSGGSGDVAIGAILGAPFLLATIGMLLVGASALGFSKRRSEGRRVMADVASARRDLTFFLVAAAVGGLLGIGVPLGVRLAGAACLLVLYVVYVVRTVRGSEAGDEEELRPLRFDLSPGDPPNWAQIILQLLVSLALIVGGAELFVHELETLAESLGVEPLVLALILAPLATELPEKVNSVLWMREGKDTLAMGNITGAMAFQGTIPVAVGLAFTPWDFDVYPAAAVVLAILGALLALVGTARRSFSPPLVAGWALLYVAFVAVVVLG